MLPDSAFESATLLQGASLQAICVFCEVLHKEPVALSKSEFWLVFMRVVAL
jgi:hypothetical protein